MKSKHTPWQIMAFTGVAFLLSAVVASAQLQQVDQKVFGMD